MNNLKEKFRSYTNREFESITWIKESDIVIADNYEKAKEIHEALDQYYEHLIDNNEVEFTNATDMSLCEYENGFSSYYKKERLYRIIYYNFSKIEDGTLEVVSMVDTEDEMINDLDSITEFMIKNHGAKPYPGWGGVAYVREC